MIRDTLFALLAQRLGQRDDLIPRMETEAQLLQEIVLEQNSWLPWFLETETASAENTLDDERLALPADFLGEIDEQGLWLYDPNEEIVWRPLKKMIYDRMIALYPDAGKPKAYALAADYFILRPIPNEVFTFKTRYMAKDAILDSNIENEWLKYASDVVLAELGHVMAAKHMQHDKLAATFREDAGKAWGRLYNKHVARQEENLNRVAEA